VGTRRIVKGQVHGSTRLGVRYHPLPVRLTDDDRVCRLADKWPEGEAEPLHRLVRQALDDLPPREKQAMTLRIIEGRSPRETAEIMRITPDTVRSHVHHALQRVRARMDDPADPLSALSPQ